MKEIVRVRVRVIVRIKEVVDCKTHLQEKGVLLLGEGRVVYLKSSRVPCC